ncbi:signal recognition particle receptor subunit alpha (macronuclear) [Tetrahymena thermophila SB210]|uniref:Signal recognition particle receptor subunit alpha n=1 Tax=Tetrahymena thermophila (strain SB210) TaxID=312017 RepID=Q22T92_TETTS|nr:signal recognition particle receptor subunit alpha [Tetrahymena thermophila SB210]EAR88546.1 signal recognition particle receptor subunit alpha [Tetrahymena thermophila SB210]|eukprot:XP_001008791.1 signal recognition particle receptor subunit alpha [Tetrahymena thermophila SB210]
MIELACIFTTSGVILFYKAFSTLRYDLVDDLIKKNLINERFSEQSYLLDNYRVMWTRDQERNLVFMIAYSELLHLQSTDKFIKLLKAIYVEDYYNQIKIENHVIKEIPSFDKGFEQSVMKWQEYLKVERERQKSTMKSFEETKKGQELKKGASGVQKKKPGKVGTEKDEYTPSGNSALNNSVGSVGSYNSIDSADESKTDAKRNSIDSSEQSEIEKARLLLKQKFEKPKKEPTPVEKPVVEQKKQKDKAVGTAGKYSSQLAKQLDQSSNKQEEDINLEKQKYLGGENEKIKGFDDISSDEDEQEVEKRGFFSKIVSNFKQLTGTKILDAQDLQPILDKFKEQLMNKNVGEQIAQQLCDSIKKNLINTQAKALTLLNKTVKESLQDAISKILTPKRNIDIIAEAMRSREKGKPYIITFIGVNGVGKSTNLAKVAYLFKKEGFSVMFAACDNFRAGAVEQIKTHGRCLEIPVFDRGYKDEPADIAFQAIREAQAKKVDVLLIDTAGRMQDNEPLMKQLSTLVVQNNPDLIVFIGEALVGNDGTDQLMKFNKALIDLSPKDRIREIDAIILSKFDTVDDKVGAALSMTYNTGKPILFCGVGQKYTHLKKLNVRTVVHALLD